MAHVSLLLDMHFSTGCDTDIEQGRLHWYCCIDTRCLAFVDVNAGEEALPRANTRCTVVGLGAPVRLIWTTPETSGGAKDLFLVYDISASRSSPHFRAVSTCIAQVTSPFPSLITASGMSSPTQTSAIRLRRQSWRLYLRQTPTPTSQKVCVHINKFLRF